ncbi:MAG: hypothetical protein AAB401_09550 [Acidobacteriota bacterium]
MDKTITLEMTKDEAEQLNAIIESCVAAMNKAHEQMASDQREIERLKVSTQAKLAEIRRHLNVEAAL